MVATQRLQFEKARLEKEREELRERLAKARADDSKELVAQLTEQLGTVELQA